MLAFNIFWCLLQWYVVPCGNSTWGGGVYNSHRLGIFTRASSSRGSLAMIMTKINTLVIELLGDWDCRTRPQHQVHVLTC
mmetsp:Transcript_16492/g.40825  ORF Transcript_16492/g.40825 Transcript_16492/m.40825 type:complete len:80 (+) Transcript_16492:1818-2057(+)